MPKAHAIPDARRFRSRLSIGRPITFTNVYRMRGSLSPPLNNLFVPRSKPVAPRFLRRIGDFEKTLLDPLETQC